MVLFGEWSDADTINALLGGGGLAAVVTAVGVLVVRYTRQRGINRVDAGRQDAERQAQDDRADAAEQGVIYAEMRGLLKLQDAHIKARDRKIEVLEGDVKAVRDDVAECRAERATLAEQNRWMKRILKKNGLFSDDEEQSYPRTKSDQIDHAGGGQ